MDASDPKRAQAHTTRQGISLSDLSEAFAEMLRTAEDSSDRLAMDMPLPDTVADSAAHVAAEAYEITPRCVLEAMLFVGTPDNQPLSREQVASVLRGVEPGDIDTLVRELNAQYADDGSAYEIVSRGAGYQMVLREVFYPIRDRFYGRVRNAKLSQAAIVVLAIVAYHQPVTAEEVGKLRGTPSGHVLAQLVRRQLLRIERPEGGARPPRYHTTDRFLGLFGLESLDDLPQTEDLDTRL